MNSHPERATKAATASRLQEMETRHLAAASRVSHLEAVRMTAESKLAEMEAAVNAQVAAQSQVLSPSLLQRIVLR